MFNTQQKIVAPNFPNFFSRRLKAYSLLEMSIALLIIGISTGSAIYLFKAFYVQYKNQLTLNRQQMVLQALGRFASQKGHLPYPSQPEEHEKGMSVPPFDDAASVAEGARNWGSVRYVGTIPWRTLGLPKHAIFDGNGRLMTYIMHPLLGNRAKLRSVTNIPEIFETRSAASGINLTSYCFAGYSSSMKHQAQTLGATPLSAARWSVKNQADGREARIHSFVNPDIVSDHQDLIVLRYTPIGRNTVSMKMKDPADPHLNCFPIYQAHDFSKVMQDGEIRNNMNKPEYEIAQFFYSCDCVAVAIISHGTTGGHYDRKGQRTVINSVSNGAKFNAKESEIFSIEHPSDNKFIVYLNAAEADFDHIVSYSTRFNLHLYGGPRCQPVVFGKQNLK